MSSELSHGELWLCPVTHAEQEPLAKEHVSSVCLPPLCMWKVRKVADSLVMQDGSLSIFCTFWMNIWWWLTSTTHASLQSSEQDIAEAPRSDPCCQLPTSFLRSVSFLHISEFWSSRFSFCLSPALCLHSVAPLSSHLSCLRIQDPPELSCLLKIRSEFWGTLEQIRSNYWKPRAKWTNKDFKQLSLGNVGK